MKKLFLVLLLLPLFCMAQQEELQEIKGLPTREVYDLLIDSKGFLWVAHDLGLSRYDGQRFTHFFNPQSQSLSVYDLLEDKQGRIWCHNYVGQVFYIENEKLQLYSPYDYTQERGFTRMVLIDNKIVLTSEKGLFVCETSTLKGRYIHCAEDSTAKTSVLAVLGDKVIASYNSEFDSINRYYVFNPSHPHHFDKINFINPPIVENNLGFTGITNISQPYLSGSTEGILFKLGIKGNALITEDTIRLNDYINGVSEVNGTTWMHSKSKSVSDKNEIIAGYNLSDIVADKEGNIWYSSLEKGLLVKYKKKWTKELLPLPDDDFVRKIAQTEKLIIYGTQHGFVFFLEKFSKKIVNIIDLHSKGGSIEFLKVLAKNYLLIGSSGAPYFFDTESMAFKSSFTSSTVKDAQLVDSILFLATSLGVYRYVQSKGFYYKPELAKNLILQRARALSYDPIHKTLLVAIKNGLFSYQDERLNPVVFDQKPIFASSIHFYKNKFFITSYLNGLFILEGNVIKHLGIEQGLKSQQILAAKLFGNNLWLIGPGTLEVFDVGEQKIVQDVVIPKIPAPNIYDILEIGNEVFITTSDGLFSTYYLKEKSTFSIRNYLLKVVVNGSNVSINNPDLHFDQNHLEFHLAAPFLGNGDKVYFKYRLLGSYEENWATVDNNENIVHFSSLMPGKYRFEAYAVHPQFGGSAKPIVYEFTISPPWYRQWWFISLLLLAALLLIIAGYKIRIQRLLREERLRRKISADLHDDIGSTLSSINIYSELAKKEKNHLPYIELIQQNVRNIVSNLDELVWNLNPKNDSLQALINKLKSHTFSIFPAKGIHCNFYISDDDYKASISSELRRHVFLAFKEIINNIVRHSESTECEIEIHKKGQRVLIVVRDNGKGVDLANVPIERNGLQNLALRAKEVRGDFEIVSEQAEGTEITFSFRI